MPANLRTRREVTEAPGRPRRRLRYVRRPCPPPPRAPSTRRAWHAWPSAARRWTEKWFPDAYVFALAGVVIVSRRRDAQRRQPDHRRRDLRRRLLGPGAIHPSDGDGGADGVRRRDLAAGRADHRADRARTPPPRAGRWRSSRCCRASSRCSTGASAWSSAACSPAPSPVAATCAPTTARSAPRRTSVSAPSGRSGLSSSAAQLQATPASLPPELLEITGVLDFGATILTWQSLTHGGGPDRAQRRDRLGLGAARARRSGPPRTWTSTSPTASSRCRRAPAPASGWSTPGSCRSSSAC